MYKEYNKEDLFNSIDKLDIQRINNTVVTKYGDKVLKHSNVSNRYEIFDISKYLKEKINILEDNFNISQYSFIVKSGIQYLRLISDVVNINGVEFYKSFFILNSTDRSRKLSFDVGLKSKNYGFYLIGNSNASFSKKHLNGVTKAAEDASSFDGETFDEQINSISGLIGNKILFSEMRNLILETETKDDVTDSNHLKFDVFKKKVMLHKEKYTNNQRNILLTKSKDINQISNENDFYLDAFWCLQSYMSIFKNRDSHIIKKESDKIMNITVKSIRDKKIELLLA